jgi:hypothetical protein
VVQVVVQVTQPERVVQVVVVLEDHMVIAAVQVQQIKVLLEVAGECVAVQIMAVVAAVVPAVQVQHLLILVLLLVTEV